MKKTLTLLAFAPMMAHAQRLEFGIHSGYGVTKSNLPTLSKNGVVQQPDGAYSTTIANKVHLAYNFRPRWQAGVDVSTTQWMHSMPKIERMNNGPQLHTINTWLSKPAYSVNTFVNYKIDLTAKSSLYGGVSVGYTFAQLPYYDVQSNAANTSLFVDQANKVRTRGFNGGIQAGYQYMFTRHFGLSAEVGARYASMRQDNKNAKGLWSFPFLLGIVFKF